MFFQQIISGIAMGGIYGLIALGFTLIWNAAAVVNFAQGEFCMVSGFLILTFFVTWGWPFAFAFLTAIFLSGVLGLIVERLTIRPIRGADPLTAIITTLGVSIFLSNSAKFVWGTHPFHFPSIFGDKPIQLGKITLIPQWTSPDMIVPDSPTVANGIVFAMQTGEQTLQRELAKAGQPAPPVGPGAGAQFRATPVSNVVLYAFDAGTGKQLYSSKKTIKGWTHFSEPVVALGKVFIVTHDGQLHALGLRSTRK